MRAFVPGAIAAAVLLLGAGLRTAAVVKAPPVFNVKGPTVIAFFPPVSDSQLDNDADLDDSLSDFQYYDDEVRTPFRKAGIELHETYTRAFSIRIKGQQLVTFRTTRNKDVGYYFIAPGKKPHVEYDVMTDEDLLDVAHEYFGIPLPDDSQDIAQALLQGGSARR